MTVWEGWASSSNSDCEDSESSRSDLSSSRPADTQHDGASRVMLKRKRGKKEESACHRRPAQQLQPTRSYGVCNPQLDVTTRDRTRQHHRREPPMLVNSVSLPFMSTHVYTGQLCRYEQQFLWLKLLKRKAGMLIKSDLHKKFMPGLIINYAMNLVCVCACVRMCVHALT